MPENCCQDCNRLYRRSIGHWGDEYLCAAPDTGGKNYITGEYELKSCADVRCNYHTCDRFVPKRSFTQEFRRFFLDMLGF